MAIIHHLSFDILDRHMPFFCQKFTVYIAHEDCNIRGRQRDEVSICLIKNRIKERSERCVDACLRHEVEKCGVCATKRMSNQKWGRSKRCGANTEEL